MLEDSILILFDMFQYAGYILHYFIYSVPQGNRLYRTEFILQKEKMVRILNKYAHTISSHTEFDHTCILDTVNLKTYYRDVFLIND